MNFFEAQDSARRATRWLVIVYLVSTLLIVAGVTTVVWFAIGASTMTTAGSTIDDPTPLLVGTAVITLLVIVGATMVRTGTLSSGGAKVATAMGGVPVSPDTRDPLKKRLLNVVEEMAIASGVPVPDVFVLEEEAGINAFAAGYTTSDAAVAVTRGTLELLDREELQGVVAHEFSHILNGDMRLNIRMMGVLYGIMVIGLLGRVMLRGSHYGALSSRRGKNGSAILLIGVGLAVLGWIGVFMARIIKSAVSRRREYLADASAVQFTRQTRGIAGALKKIGGYSESSMLSAKDPEEVSHMLFGTGMKLSSVFATHPPLLERIQALEPSFDASAFPVVDTSMRESVRMEAASQLAGIAGGDVTPANIVDTIGNPQPEQVALAGQIRRGIPQPLYDDAHSAEGAWLLAIALLLDKASDGIERQLLLVGEQLGSERSERIRGQLDLISEHPRALRLPLLEIAFRALKLRPAAELEYLVDLLERLVNADGRIDLYEFCYYRIVRASLSGVVDPPARPRTRKLTRNSVRAAALDVVAVLSRFGHADESQAARAFDAGMATLPDWAHDAKLADQAETDWASLDKSLDLLSALNAKGLEMLVNALVAAAGSDGRLVDAERELLRTVCAVLGCPLPVMGGLEG